jgi:IS4 transposase
MDRAYLDVAGLYRVHQSHACCVTRTKHNFVFKRLYSHPVDKSIGVQADPLITVTGFYSQRDYPEQLRRIRYHDTDTKPRLVFLTNQFSLPAIVIAQRSTCRWQVELFFKWIKQPL